jgi:hypothetical protein
MTRHLLLWITACAVTLGAVTATPAAVGAQEDAAGWNVTIDPMGPEKSDVVDTRRLEITGDATLVGVIPVENVTVTVVPRPPLPPECGSARSAMSGVSAGRYAVVIEVVCNGPYEIQAVARSGRFDSGAPTTRTIGVGEIPPPPPDAPISETKPGGGLRLTWPASGDVDSAGWILLVDSTATPLEPDVLSRDVPPGPDSVMLALRSVRWGPGGPGVDTLASGDSRWVLVDLQTETPNTEPTPTVPTPTEPPVSTPNPGPGGTTPTGTSPPSTNGGTPPPGTGSTAPLPEGYTEELPYGVPDDAFVPEDRVAVDSEATDRDLSAAGTTPSAGLVRTSEKRSPGLVAPFALALLLFTIAAHITWYLRRSKPTGGGQVTLL